MSRKRPLFNGYKKEPQRYTRKCFVSLKTLMHGCQTDGATLRTSCSHPLANGGTKHLTESVFDLLSSWTDDTQSYVTKVLEHLKQRQANHHDTFLTDSVNKKFLQFHRDMTEECGSEDKQHSWAVIEKREEVVMYGPYYPDYNSGEHSEDVVIKQTQALLDSDAVSEDCKVFVFTRNSPCLARNCDPWPCMLNLVRKAHEWWTVYGVKTVVGYVKCWGFKGAKETLFRDINSSQVDYIDQTEDHAGYVEAAKKRFGVSSPVCEDVFSAVKNLLSSESFPLLNVVRGQDWKGYFKSMQSVFESKPEEEKKIFTQELDTAVEAAQALLLSVENGSVEEYLEKGRAFATDCTFGSQVSDVSGFRDDMRVTFQQCWKEMVQDKHAEFIRETLTERFNQCTVQLFINDVMRFTEGHLQIGRIQFSEEDNLH